MCLVKINASLTQPVPEWKYSCSCISYIAGEHGTLLSENILPFFHLSPNLHFTPSVQEALLQRGSMHLPEQAAAPCPPKGPFLQSGLSARHHFLWLPVFGQLLFMGCAGETAAAQWWSSWQQGRGGKDLLEPMVKHEARQGREREGQKGASAAKQRGGSSLKAEVFIKADQIILKRYCAGAHNAAMFAAFIKTNGQSSR